jgi:putative hydrolase of the HAD superfamily
LAEHQQELTLSEVKAVFFDFGDTLVTLSPPKDARFMSAARSIGLELEIESVRRAYQIIDFHNKYSSVNTRDREEFYRGYNEKLCEVLGISSYLATLLPAVAVQFADTRWELIGEAKEVVRRLHQRGLRLALVANWDASLAALAESLGVGQFFATVISSQEAGVEKPDPAIFRLAVERLGLSGSSDGILYVGNEYRADVLGARAAGLTPVLIDRNGSYPGSDCLRFTSLEEWLESIC